MADIFANAVVLANCSILVERWRDAHGHGHREARTNSSFRSNASAKNSRFEIHGTEKNTIEGDWKTETINMEGNVLQRYVSSHVFPGNK